MQHLAAICRHCGDGDWVAESGVRCTSLACTVFYERRKVQKELQSLSSVAADEGFYPKCMVEWFWALVISTCSSTVGIQRKDFPCSIFSTPHISPFYEWGYCCSCTYLLYLVYLALYCKLYFVFFRWLIMLYITTKKSDTQRNPLFCCDVNTVPCSNKKVVNASNPQDSYAQFVCTYI